MYTIISPKYFNNVSDEDIQISQNKNIYPSLKLYNNIPIMINSNREIDKGLVKGTLGRLKGIKPKKIIRIMYHIIIGMDIRLEQYQSKILNIFFVITGRVRRIKMELYYYQKSSNYTSKKILYKLQLFYMGVKLILMFRFNYLEFY